MIFFEERNKKSGLKCSMVGVGIFSEKMDGIFEEWFHFQLYLYSPVESILTILSSWSGIRIRYGENYFL